MVRTSIIITGLMLCTVGFTPLSAQQTDVNNRQFAASDSVQLGLADIPEGLVLVRSRIEQLRLEHLARAGHIPGSEAMMVSDPASESAEHTLRFHELERLIMMLEFLESTDASGLADFLSVPLDFSFLSLQIPFEISSAVIPDETFPVLREIGAWLLRYPNLRLEIQGHTDITGPRSLNMRLSQQRAASVQRFLLGEFPGLSADRLPFTGLGPDQPVATNETEAGRAQNRRVDFLLTE
ncbi:OmpA family protein [Cyclonatronum proteinivorum]|uniref:OmpA family protein n=1 Tax=Cyclonatronum proteinivorum TaxID=1457365 RepID=A0A345UGH8_9BACT|nr:OmpA family protein [Cyclonatronum proteinivorum]AXI99579.1 OmpA family protein [Cyclonatronum proteinivorum]